jgi:predicted adenine nucleotide alpha hydrolase (AANH) superfamily ATPase
MIEKIGKEISKKYNIQFLIPNNICKNLETKGFYKQVFCGCCYSLVERFEEKF